MSGEYFLVSSFSSFNKFSSTKMPTILQVTMQNHSFISHFSTIVSICILHSFMRAL
ncbi:hypothetical protein VB002_05685 [Campylobacter concisus]